MTQQSIPVTDPLSIVALDTERHVAMAGWDQNPRLFALVRTADVAAAEPSFAAGLSGSDLAPDALTAVEQEGLPNTSSIESMLGRLAWPETVEGCAIVVERVVVPPEAERDLPGDPEKAVDALQRHPDRQDVRLLVAALRGGSHRCLLRQRAHDSDDQVASGEEIAPGLVAALLATLAD